MAMGPVYRVLRTLYMALYPLIWPYMALYPLIWSIYGPIWPYRVRWMADPPAIHPIVIKEWVGGGRPRGLPDSLQDPTRRPPGSTQEARYSLLEASW